MQFVKKQQNFDSDPPVNFLIDRKSEKFSQDQLIWPIQFQPNLMYNIALPQYAPNQSFFDEGIYLLDNNPSNFNTIKKEEVDESIIGNQNNNLDSQPTSQKSFRTLRNGKRQSPKPLDVNNVFLQRSACKNALQFFSWAFEIYFKQKNFFLTTDQQRLIQQLKKAPTIRGFDYLFKQGGNIKIGLSQFFLSNNVWQLILASRVRHHRYKLIMKRISNMIRKAFISRRFQGLSSLKQQKQTKQVYQYALKKLEQ